MLDSTPSAPIALASAGPAANDNATNDDVAPQSTVDNGEDPAMEIDADENGGEDAVRASLHEAIDEVDTVIDRQGDNNVV